MTEDDQLIGRFCREGDDDAFAILVRKYVDLVYSVALRTSRGRSDLASDITQQVFIDLSRKASTIPTNGVLGAWLHQAAYLATLSSMRSETRRSIREGESVQRSDHERDEEAFDWQRLSPILDEAISSLGIADRQALVLRFFERRSFLEIGQVLGVAEDAARMRVQRGVGRLRDYLASRGIRSSDAALGVALEGTGSIAAPPYLAAQICNASHASMAGSVAQWISLMNSKLILTSLTAILCLAPWWLARSTNIRLQQELIEAQRALASLATLPESRVPEQAEPQADRVELLRLRGEVAALRRSLQTQLSVAAYPSSVTTGRKYGDQFSMPLYGRMFDPKTSEDLGPTPPIYLSANYLGQAVRLDMLQNSGNNTLTNAVETALWSAINGNRDRFSELFRPSVPGASEDQLNRNSVQQMGILKENLTGASELEFRSMALDDQSGIWSMLVMVDSKPLDPIPGTHFNFQAREVGERWEILGITFGAAPGSTIRMPSEVTP